MRSERHDFRHTGVLPVCLPVLLIATTILGAEETETEATPVAESARPVSWFDRERITGDWGGARTWLADHGISLESSYSADFFWNFKGGLNTANADQYRGLFDIDLVLDTETMGLWEGGAFFLSFQQIHGSSITVRHVGDLQFLNNNDAPDRTQLAEYYLEQSLLEDVIRVQIGKMDVNASFAYTDNAGEFINSSGGYSPVIPLPTFPDPALGAAMFVEPVDWFYVAAGVYDGQGEGDRTGFDTAFHGPQDSFSIFETGVMPTLTLGNQNLDGAYRIGGWYHSGEWETFPAHESEEPGIHSGHAGLYLNFDQKLYVENPDNEADEQGLGAFFVFAWAPPSYSEIEQFYACGAQYTGLIPTRDDDVTGLGMFHANLSGRVRDLEDRHSETAIEFFHRFQITPYLSMKPDMQYIIRPGGDGRDAFVAGVRLEMLF